MRKAIATAALTLGGLTVGTLGASAASASPVIDDNEHHVIQTGGLINLGLQDVLTNSNILNGLLAGGVNVLDEGVNVDL